MLTRVRRWWHGYWAAKHADELVIAEAELIDADLDMRAGLRSPHAYGEKTVMALIRRHRLAEYACSVYRKNLEYHEEKLKQT